MTTPFILIHQRVLIFVIFVILTFFVFIIYLKYDVLFTAPVIQNGDDNFMKPLFSWSFFFLLVICVGGCTKNKFVPTEYIEGIVTLDGEIVPEGTTVSFIPATPGVGEPAAGFTNKDGLYKLTSASGASEKGALEGDYRITVSKMEVTSYDGENYGETNAKAPKDPVTGAVMLSTSKHLLPEVYAQIAKTPLTYTVVKGKQTHNIELQSKP